MKFKILIVLSLVLSISFSSCNDDTVEMGNWVTMAYFTGVARANATCFSFDSVAYFGLGKNEDEYLNSFYKYNVDKDAWIEVDSFPGTPRAYNICVATESKGYMGLGYDGDNDLKDFWEFDPSTNKWTQLADFPGGERRYASAFAIGEDVYVGLGTSDHNDYYWNDFWKYSNGTWTSLNSFPGEKRLQANVVTLNGKAFIISGYHSGVLYDFYEYDPTTDSWTKLDKLNDENTGNTSVARYNACAFVSGGNIYLAGGVSGSSSLSSIFEWSPVDSIWTEKSELETNLTRQGASCFVVNDIGYILAGVSGSTNYLDDMYKFEPWVEKDSDDN